MKTDEKKERDIELRSEELQEIIGRIPSSIEKYGILVMACIVSVLIIGSFFFCYPDTIDAPIVITNSTPPVNIVSKANGKIVKIFKANEESVRVDDLLGIIESDADYQAVLDLDEMINELLSGSMTDEEMLYWMYNHELKLGGLQDAYQNFRNSLLEKNRFIKAQYLPQKIKTAKERIATREELERKERNMHEILIEQEAIAYEIYKRDSLLHISNMMTDEDFERASLSFSQSKQGPINRKIEDEQYRMQQINEREGLLDLVYQNDETNNKNEQNYNNAIQQLRAAIDRWEQTYFLKSPINGSLNYTSVWNENQIVNAGEVIFIIVPEKMEEPIGKAYVPVAGMGRIQVGQTVIVTVNNFPDEDFGNLIGKVNFISNVPTSEGVYMVDIIFPDGLTTIFNKQLPQTLQLIGTSQIVAENRRIADLFIQPVRRLLKSQEALSSIEK